MYSITLLPQQLQNFIVSLNTNNTSRDGLTTLAIARVLGDKFSLPTAPVTSIEAFFNMHNKAQLFELVSNLNELTILDTNAIIDYTNRFYKFRYEKTYPSTGPLALNVDKAIIDFFGISKVFDPETIKLIESNPIKLTDMCHKFNDIIKAFSSDENMV